MRVNALKSFYEKNKIDLSKYEETLSFLIDLEKQVKTNQTLEEIDEDILDHLISYLLINNQSTIPHFIYMMRYFKAVQRNDLFIHLTKYTGSLGVIESILDKLDKVIGKEKALSIRNQIKIAPLGTHPSKMPIYTKNMLKIFDDHLTPEEIKKTLSDNHHQIPKEAFLGERVHYEAASSFDEYLKGLHERKIEELEKHFKENRVWFEQEINQEVLDFVSSNQEILSAVRKDNKLYITKIPYDTKAYLEAKTHQDKLYHACHCPFVKSIFMDDTLKISPTWCNCSGGFTKYPFEVLFDQELDITCIETPLKGDELCRFVISLENVEYKR